MAGTSAGQPGSTGLDLKRSDGLACTDAFAFWCNSRLISLCTKSPHHLSVAISDAHPVTPGYSARLDLQWICGSSEVSTCEAECSIASPLGPYQHLQQHRPRQSRHKPGCKVSVTPR
jgi:hypothetical protein